MKLHLLNPNTSASMTSLMAGAASSVASPGTEIFPTTARIGFPYVSSRVEAEICATHIFETIAEHHKEMDAVIISAFGDPGLIGARQLFDIPVVGVAEAAMLTACALGERFSIVTFSDGLADWFHDSVLRAGLERRFAGMRLPSEGFQSIDDVQDELAERLVELVEEAVRVDRADVAILAGGPLAGLAAKVGHRLPVPAVDPVASAVVFAEGLVRLGVGVAKAGGFARPPAKSSIGLPDSLAKRIEHTDDSAPSGSSA
ncbi:MAG: aspartate/glutamate racemase family protein [Verrucomicrobiota bacterium]